MEKLKFTIHPLFFIFGLYFAFCGKVFSFLTYTLVACIHECGHYVASSKRGYKLKRVVLMPYGAVIRGDKQDFSYVDEVMIALAGPAINAATAVIFIALWWIFPEVYPFTELAVEASLTIAIINMLPAYPLDGGRVLLATLSLKMSRKTALKIVKAIGVIVSAAMLGLFVYSCFTTLNVSLLFFSSFMLFGNLFLPKDNVYTRICSYYSPESLKRGKIVKRVAINERTLVRDLFGYIENGYLLEVEIVGEKKKAVLSCDKTAKIIMEGDIYRSVSSEAERLFSSSHSGRSSGGSSGGDLRLRL